ncbi:hypothetical protein CJS34_007915 [Campylobacter jejuni]|uniref:hypothetical protein n=1 Tax=Campylobacter jejuni TaxID=197 RepID=UPI0007073BCE|nr:hypothetical protein [Campylobacter jejuni]EAH5782664.1 hypothetical protein [Campylobacter jejuni]EAH9854825.1 hypothetical protein [Campylobacter jejuni]EAI1280595.1 hypothetical protein [Campylobacter jejuni]EAI8145369.1 hypothetical protein [Campylobacter jejuni]EAJ4008661.1 hypothetical protein [Campylobacter jejuni]
MNTSLNEEQKKNIENKFLEFQRIWTLEKVESMTLEEYASIKKDNQDRNDFTFWIENIDFGDAIKWKIAFHYQDVNNIKIVNIFSKNVLDLISLNKFKEKLKTYQIYEKLLENKNLSLIKMVENLSIPLWFQYREKYVSIWGKIYK